jgi:hypothetical protein
MSFLWNIYNWAAQNVPALLNKPKLNAWLQALLFPLLSLYNDFFNFRLQIEKQMRIKWRTNIMEAYLNDLFDPIQRRIVITTATDINPPNYVYDDDENNPLYLYDDNENQPLYVYDDNEYGVAYNFTVQAHIGSLTAAQIIQLKSIINTYRFAGKKPRYIYDNGVQF